MIRKAKISKHTPVADLLAKAARLLTTEGGWVQGTYYERGHNGKTTYCAVGALDEAGRQLNTKQLYEPAREFMKPFMPAHYVDDLVGFNDTDGRKAKEVISVFKKAAAAAKKAGA